MSKTIIALDCMGGDNAPGEIVKGAVLAANENKDMLIKLVGREDDIKKELEKYPSSDKLEIVDAKEVIETGEPPVAAIRKKKDSSLVKCMYMVKKGEADAKRGAIFNKLSREIFVAAKAGDGDPSMNARLRMVLDKARAANMPKDNINRAIKKATDVGDTTNYDEITYEGYGPGGVAILVHTLTDNKKRTDANMHTIFTRNGGNMGSTGSVAYMFDRKGYIVIDRENWDLDEDSMLELILDAGAEDLKTLDEAFEVFTEPKEFPAVKEALQAQNLEFAQAQLSMIPQNYVSLDAEQADILETLVDKLEDDDDVQDVYTNMAD